MSRPCATAPSALARLKAPTTRPATRERARRVVGQQQDPQAEHADRHRAGGRQDHRRAGAGESEQRAVAPRALPRVRQDAHAPPRYRPGHPRAVRGHDARNSLLKKLAFESYLRNMTEVPCASSPTRADARDGSPN